MCPVETNKFGAGKSESNPGNCWFGPRKKLTFYTLTNAHFLDSQIVFICDKVAETERTGKLTFWTSGR